GGQAAFVDFGAANAFAAFDVVIDWTACESDGTEVYRVEVQGSATADFCTFYVLDERRFGVLTGQGNNTPPSGRAILRASNVALTSATSGTASTALRYVRVFCTVTGSPATGFNYSASLARQ
ncbi:MAG: hypothetical protein ACK5BN_01200, partial [Planctomycetota bacterium]